MTILDHALGLVQLSILVRLNYARWVVNKKMSGCGVGVLASHLTLSILSTPSIRPFQRL
jgi:hypothetical protein